MKRAILIGLAAVALAPGIALAQGSSLNNESVCSGPGYGMDPRCVGEATPGGWTDNGFNADTRGLYIIQQPVRRR